MRTKETPEEKRERVRNYLMNCSGQELSDFLMRRHAEAAVCRRQMRDLLDRWVEETADARLAAEVNIIREELKHRSVLPFPKKVEETPPHRETPTTRPPLDHGDHRRANFDVMGVQDARKFIKR